MDLLERLRRLTEPLVISEGMELVDIEFRREPRGWVLRVFIDKEGGVTINDCVSISQQLGDILDVKDLIPHSYSLEVSSPGVERPLKKEEDFRRFAGRKARLFTQEPVDGKRFLEGILRGIEEGVIYLETSEGLKEVHRSVISRAHLVFDIKEYMRARRVL